MKKLLSIIDDYSNEGFVSTADVVEIAELWAKQANNIFLRDVIAMNAMNALITTYPNWGRETVVLEAYKIADKMIEISNK